MATNIAEQIYVASARDGESASRLAEDLARRVEDDIAALGLMPGASLGSLRVLAERYRMGRAVVREAVGLLERRGLGRMRPGPSGGFILTKPQFSAVAAELARHFRASGVGLRQLLDAREVVDLTAACMAAMATPPDTCLRYPDTSPDSAPVGGMLQLRVEIARMARQPALVLMVECLNRLTVDLVGAETIATATASPGLVAQMRAALRLGSVSAAEAAAARAHCDLVAALAQPHPPVPVADSTESEDAPALTPARIARELASQIARSGQAGARLGSEWDLCERFGVGRLTLRQAIRLLQDGGLVECRRGRGNGLVVRNRGAAGGIRLMLAALIGEKLDPIAAGMLLLQLNRFMPVLAVSRANAEERSRLLATISRLEGGDSIGRCALLSLVQSVSRLADSPIIDLFSRCLAAYEARFRTALAADLPASAHTSYFRLLRRFLDRIPLAPPTTPEWAKRESAALLLQMSVGRPI
ncbi:MAG TPA: GntR family transcriptional regulator [Steroidobacteraceae bacterium]|nr:GntR family transcriptional regulator [Steroidobacteraceae bacterium]